MSNERKFWEDVISTMNPEWQVAIQSDSAVGELRLSDQRVRVYLVDTENLWVLMGATREVDAETAKEQTDGAPDMAAQLVGSIGHYLVDCSKRGLDHTSPEAQRAVSLSLLALTRTRTFDQVKKATGGYAGHWLYILYRLRDGNVLARPGFVSAAKPGLLPTQELVELIKRIVRQDLHGSARTHIASEVKKGGGVNLNEAFR